MKRVPIPVENIDFIRLDLSRHYIQIDCDFVCYIVLNPSGNIPVGGTDVCLFHIGAWQVDAWKFLTKDFAQIPGFSACLVWDKTLVTERAKAPQVAESDIDTANSISSLKGQPVNITGFSLAEGESLKVSTLDGEFCNVAPYQDIPLKNQLFLHSKLFFFLKKGSSFDFSQLPSHCVSEIEGGYRIVAPVMSGCHMFNTSGAGDGFYFKNGEYHYFVNNTTSNNAHRYTGVLASLYVDISVTDDVITDIISHYAGVQIREDNNSGGASLDSTFLNIERLYIEF